MHELLTPREMAEADRLAMAGGQAGIDLMERAGAAVAKTAGGLSPLNVLVLCGPGNNGGDGFVAARLLRDRGLPTKVALAGQISAVRGDAALAAARWQGPIEDAFAVSIPSATLVIDALFGAGLARDIDGEMAMLIDRVNASGCAVLAVDLPSGIDGETGAIRGCAVKAGCTVTFFRKKPGHVLLPGRLHCGDVTVADIGIPGEVLAAIKPKAGVNTPHLWGDVFPRPAIDGNKYSRGNGVVVSAGLGMTGAAKLAARAALRAGAGMVIVASPADALLVHAIAAEAVIVRRCDGAAGLGSLLEDARRNAVLIGPGLPPDAAARQMTQAVLAARRAAVIDAGALTAFQVEPERLFQAIRNAAMPCVLTPHDGEFSRLFPKVEGSRLARARQAAEICGAVVALKGPDTVVARPDGAACLLEKTSPWLATAGSGDVLAGMVLGLLAQGMPAFEAAAAAVWLHAEAALGFGPGLTAEDLPDLLPAVLRKVLKDFCGPAYALTSNQAAFPTAPNVPG